MDQGSRTTVDNRGATIAAQFVAERMFFGGKEPAGAKAALDAMEAKGHSVGTARHEAMRAKLRPLIEALHASP
jgi:hypothetical protein